MKKLYMLTNGQYSDYCVSGLYETELNLDDADVIRELKTEFHKSLGFDGYVDFDFYRKYHELISGMKEPERPMTYHYGSVGDYHRDCIDYDAKSKEFDDKLKSAGKELYPNFSDWLIETKGLKKVDYTEVWGLGE